VSPCPARPSQQSKKQNKTKQFLKIIGKFITKRNNI
jgi:hypothetical protein